MSFRQLSSNDTALPSITEFRVHFMSLCSEILPPRMAASICAFPISHSILGPAALGKKPSDVISHGVSTPPPSRQHWQRSQFFYQQEPVRRLPWALADPWLNLKRWQVVYISVVSVVGSGAVVILFATWGDWRGMTSGMRGSDFFTDLTELWALALSFEQYSSGFLYFVQLGSDGSDWATPLLAASYIG